MALRHRRYYLIKDEDTNKEKNNRNETYDEVKAKYKAWNKEHYSGLKHSKRKSPWYVMTSGKQYNFETRKTSWGEHTDYFRVLSEAGKFHNLHTISKTTHEQYKERLIEAKLKDWEKKHPRPIPKDDKQKDLFEAQFMVPWVDEHTKAREEIIKFVDNIGNRAKVYARYEHDVGTNNLYPTKIMELRSDGKKLISDTGNHANFDSTVVRKVQRAANAIKAKDSKLIALKIVDKNQELIVIPKAA